mmetsp:Transcript_9394/g.27924  ORF Transcript_9394/g.27924 Transcript_9394/m.27924 type:complete len:235 (-) Transcript_9394:338-1042(-)
MAADEEEGVVEGVALVRHQVRYHDGGTPRDSCSAVYQDRLLPRDPGVDEFGRLGEEHLDGLSADVLHVHPIILNLRGELAGWHLEFASAAADGPNAALVQSRVIFHRLHAPQEQVWDDVVAVVQRYRLVDLVVPRVLVEDSQPRDGLGARHVHCLRWYRRLVLDQGRRRWRHGGVGVPLLRQKGRSHLPELEWQLRRSGLLLYVAVVHRDDYAQAERGGESWPIHSRFRADSLL